MPREKSYLPLRTATVQIVTSKEIEEVVKSSFAEYHYWSCTASICPIYCHKVVAEKDASAERAVEHWLSGRNGPRYSVGTEAMIRFLCARGIIEPGNYLVVARVEDEEAWNDPTNRFDYESQTKGIF